MPVLHYDRFHRPSSSKHPSSVDARPITSIDHAGPQRRHRRRRSRRPANAATQMPPASFLSAATPVFSLKTPIAAGANLATCLHGHRRRNRCARPSETRHGKSHCSIDLSFAFTGGTAVGDRRGNRRPHRTDLAHADHARSHRGIGHDDCRRRRGNGSPHPASMGSRQ